VWDPSRYVERQTQELRADRDYPLDRYVDKHWAPLGKEQPWEGTATAKVAAWLDSDEPRFVLILGDFGTGKTFLLQRLAYDLRNHHQLAPVLVRMRDLQKSRTLDELVAQHMATREDPFHLRSFRYLLRQGRIVLLFDGFDELALRTDYDRVVAHFETLQEAAGGAATVVATSRHQYFATDHAVRKALGTRVEALPGSRIIRLFPLSPAQRRQLVVLTFGGDEARADRFLAILGGVRDLLDLATNPRMLTFMIR
jgi:chromosomal replication initiation ATPase DnaA